VQRYSLFLLPQYPKQLFLKYFFNQNITLCELGFYINKKMKEFLKWLTNLKQIELK